MTVKYLVTSGCSFSTYSKWPYVLSNRIQAENYSRGQDSCGNDWIARSIIHQTSKMLEEGVDPSEILIVAMWSGIDRKGLFISKQETPHYNEFLGARCPIHFLNTPPNTPAKTDKESGYISGNGNSLLGSQHAINYKSASLQYLTYEELAVESYEHFLTLQWFCKSHNIKLFNLTYGDIFHYPNFEFLEPKKTGTLTKDFYPSVRHLHNLINFDQWAFYDETGGLFEYALNNGLAFDADGHHPSFSANEHYVDNFLVPVLKEKALI